MQDSIGYFVYEKQLKSSSGCDSSVVLALNVLPMPTVRIEPKDLVLCNPGDEVTLYAVTGDEEWEDDTDDAADYPSAFIYDCDLSYRWNTGETTASITKNPINPLNIYTVTVTTQSGCSATASEKVLVNAHATIIVNDTICSGETYTGYGLSKTTSGTYSATIYQDGCDDVPVSLNLFVHPPAIEKIIGTVCAGERYQQHGLDLQLYQPGIFRDTLHFLSHGGCDSTLILEITVNPAPEAIIHDVVCQNEPYSKNGFNLPAQTIVGEFTHTRTSQTVQSCKSTTTLKLLVTPVYTNIISDEVKKDSAYNKYDFNFPKVTKDTTVTKNLTSVDGCDSTVILNLKVETVELTECPNGTLLFKEDFDKYGDGLDPTSPNLSADPLPTGRTTYGFVSAYRPGDGEYALAKYWNDGDWLIDDDNTSPEDNTTGRFMLINADYNPGLFYSHQLDNLCAGTTLHFSAMVANCHIAPYSGLNPNLSFSLLNALTNDVIVSYNTGEIPPATKISDWLQKEFYFTVPVGINAVILEVRNNELGGFGNDLGLDDIEIRLCTPPVEINTPPDSVCIGENVNFTTSFTNDGTFTEPLVYLWLKSETGDLTSQDNWLSVGTNDALKLNSIQKSDEGYYRLAIAGQGGIQQENCRAMSDPFFLFVKEDCAPPPCAIDSLNLAICQGDSILFGGNYYKSSGIYSDTLQTILGCDSIVSINLTVNPVYQDLPIPATICQGDSILFGENYYKLVGIYSDTLQTILGCDSIVSINLTVNPVYLDLPVPATICQGDSILFGENYYKLVGIYSDTLQTIFGCDSIVSIDLTVNPVYQDLPVPATICQGDSILFGGNYYKSAGIYNDTLQTILGCDSIVFINLTVNPVYQDLPVPATICQGDSILFGENYYKLVGIYSDTLQTIFGCDSIVSIDLTVNPVYQDLPVPATICQGDSILFGGNYYKSAGIYNDTLQTILGCDSIVSIDLTVNPVYQDLPVPTTICQGDSILFGGNYYKSSGIYNDTLQTILGCDSIVSIDLTVNSVYLDLPVPTTICQGDSILFGGNYYKSSGIYRDTIPRPNGCDSVSVLDLTVHLPDTIPLYDTIYIGNDYNLNGFTISVQPTKGSLKDTLSLQNQYNCDSLVILNLEVICPKNEMFLNKSICSNDSYLFKGEYLNVSGIYRDTIPLPNGCDSVSVLDLTVHLPDTIPLYDTIYIGNDYNLNGFTISVQPTKGSLTDTLSFQNQYNCDSLVILNLEIICPKNETFLNKSICQYDSYLFKGQYLNVSGIYRDTIPLPNGCDSVSVLDLTVHLPDTIPLYDTIYIGNDYNLNGFTISVQPTKGSLTDTLSFQNQYNCDSLVILNLEIICPKNETFLNKSICQYDSYLFKGQYLNVSGIYRDTIPLPNGCDSVSVLDLTVHLPDTIPLYDTIYIGNDYNLNGFTISVQPTKGSLTDTLSFQNQYNCDSLVILNLEIICPKNETFLNKSICQYDSYFFKGEYLNVSGTYRDTIPMANGCDSVSVLDLTVHLPDTIPLYDTISIGNDYTLNNFTIPVQSSKGSLTDTLFLKNRYMCDSIVILNLEVVCPSSAETSLHETICQGESYDHGFALPPQDITGSFVHSQNLIDRFGCDSIVTLHLTVKPLYEKTIAARIPVNEPYNDNGFSLLPQPAPGFFTRENRFIDSYGCDSVITLHLTVYAEIIPDEFFTPNGDDIGDVWNIKNIEYFTIESIKIYDRFEKLLVQYADKFTPWDGTYLGHAMPSTDYWYVIVVREEAKSRVGHFTLLRR